MSIINTGQQQRMNSPPGSQAKPDRDTQKLPIIGKGRTVAEGGSITT